MQGAPATNILPTVGLIGRGCPLGQPSFARKTPPTTQRGRATARADLDPKRILQLGIGSGLARSGVRVVSSRREIWKLITNDRYYRSLSRSQMTTKERQEPFAGASCV